MDKKKIKNDNLSYKLFISSNEDIIIYDNTNQCFRMISKNNYETMSLVEKRITIRTFIKKIVWDGENIHIYFWGDDDGENIIFPEDDNNDDAQMFPLGQQSKRNNTASLHLYRHTEALRSRPH